ncbi:3-phosphoshikimate 1-carboxyvinyltransferase [Furfurilactobacillus siliginis]|uniref:3-phosphoshikimate 1-carboxyvinyltransferase n=1 Tax=Furfurilactobacillus siliginis TaxID=348151 RepID=A0A0R2L2A3_9LACO|nr:3-phosphoshikimate 1-carboxyvinyltransferase [Furfurilactobacillus siliginis]KRN95762.1 3-phosphoshikimate 1-carboxyvinyltransferase [Furfurilactobacillus siliginis]GEK28962.1 3-phosphoshikimate 1-carboxyvinyltransferase [Furfurilactobacillus siliginis]
MKQLQGHVAGLQGTLAVPGDKSISHRGLMIGAISAGITRLHNFLPSADCLATLAAVQALGVAVDRPTPTEVTITGVGKAGLHQAVGSLDMMNSGTSTRLFMGLLAGQTFDSTLTGDASLSKRPMRRVADPLLAFGADVNVTSAGTLPATIHGQPLHAANVQMNVASAQVKSALILAALQAPGVSTIVETLPTRDHTERMLRAFGANVQTTADQRTITVVGQPELVGQTLTVPGDMSSAAFFMTAASLTKNAQVHLKNVGINETRTGLLKVLQEMGGRVMVDKHMAGGEPVADLTIETADLHSITLGEKDIPALIDELPLVALLAARAQGVTTITGAAELRVKETDRIATIATELTKMGAEVRELPDGLVITGHADWHPQSLTLDSHGDHRIGMMLAVAALQQPETFTLDNADAVAVSYPNFFEDLAQLITPEAV